MCPVGDLFPKQQQAQKCEKSSKGNWEWWRGGGGGWGEHNGGSPQSKQVGLKPACPSFQPSAAEIRDKQMLNPSG